MARKNSKTQQAASSTVPAVSQGQLVRYCPRWPVKEGEAPQVRAAFVALPGADGRHGLAVVWAPGDTHRDPESSLAAIPYSEAPAPGTWSIEQIG